MAEEGRTERDDGASPEQPARPWHRSPWLWTGVVIAVVGAALGLSILVGTDQRDPDLADVDHTEFCRQVVAFTVVASGGVDPVSDLPKVRALADAMRAVERAAPETIRTSAKDWADGYHDAARKLDLVLAKYPANDPAAYDEAIAVVELVGSEKEVAIDRVTNYATKACGVDLTKALSLTTSEATTPDGTLDPSAETPATLGP